MENAALYVDNKTTPDHLEALTDSALHIFRVGRETGMDQATIVAVFQEIAKGASRPVSISGCTFYQGEGE